ncbi:acyl-CoA dehydrogenase family protein [Couchioplanes caeruleus]|uniref:Acyl-CoA dehydrogenase n=2 Tax=Couchioplanes caeruleus TaxID=56438 RepID=A0A1K0GRM4_9ACTN|nr:acyl-CoA dehydrogenase family protein [Couchioplanes caeruleus]OJF13860.1 acyl-CoA dehydrogenase [Couchioplanes caeruleus subsp. caeruleus]ROP34155.1 glutaryl-CoA dehydrogenase [Couchioplanes caeruleus]
MFELLTGDLYRFQDLLTPEDAEVVTRVRTFLEAEVVPVANDHWARAEFPFPLVKGFADLGIAGARHSNLLSGWIALEMARADASMATFFGVHSGLAMGSIETCGSAEQQERWLPRMRTFEKIGAFALTEPTGGSDVAAGLRTTARRDGDRWILNGKKRWIGNGTFADLIVVWARDVADDQVKGFVVHQDNPGFAATKIENKIALRTVQNADITLTECEVPEADRLQNARSFKDTAKVLRQTRSGVAWEAVGVMLAAYEIALKYAKEREQFGRPIGGFQLVQDLLVRMLGNVTGAMGMCVRLAQLQDAGEFRDEHSALAKAYTTTRMREVVGWARELLAGNGIVLDYDIGRFVADAEALYSYEGTREINTMIVGRAVTGLSAFV